MADPKRQVMDQIKQQLALANAKMLLEVYRSSFIFPAGTDKLPQKINEHCFERCVPKPGNSLSTKESTCYTHCMEKYMQAWNTVSNQYIRQIQTGAAGRAANIDMEGIN